MSPTARDRRIRALRPAKPGLDPWRPIATLLEEERLPGGGLVPAWTVFLAGRECPFTCVFCDLWRFTTDAPTPPGAIPAQLRAALAELPPPGGAHAKLYNASNFFDPGAVPPADDREILSLLTPFPQVVVECHPRLVGRRCLAFAEGLAGRLQVAMGLETVHPGALPRLGKRATLDDFRRAAQTLSRHGIGLRAFVLAGAPFVPAAEALRWVERSVGFAFEHGAEHVTLIPVRGGGGEMERLRQAGDFAPPTLALVERAVDRCLPRAAGAVTVDTWDLRALADCPACAERRIARLERANLRGRLEAAVNCADCGGLDPIE